MDGFVMVTSKLDNMKLSSKYSSKKSLSTASQIYQLYVMSFYSDSDLALTIYNTTKLLRDIAKLYVSKFLISDYLQEDVLKFQVLEVYVK